MVPIKRIYMYSLGYTYNLGKYKRDTFNINHPTPNTILYIVMYTPYFTIPPCIWFRMTIIVHHSCGSTRYLIVPLAKLFIIR